MTESEKDAAEELAALASYELMRNSMIGLFCPSIIQPADAPDHWILCQGGNFAMADYPALMEIYPSILKNYPSAGRFTVPDMRDRTFIGAGGTFAFLQTGGEINHTLTVAEMPAHTHSEVTAVAAVINGGLEAPAAAAVPGAGFTGSQGSGQPHNNMQPYGAGHWYLVAR